MRPAAVLTGIAGIAVIAGLLAAGGTRLGGSDIETAATGEEAPSAAENAQAVPPPRAVPDPKASMTARPVDPASRFYPAEVGGKPLERLAAAEPEKPKVAAGKGVDLVRPIAEGAGLLSFGGKRLQLTGIIPTPDDRICKTPDGTDWPCGMLAKTNFRLFLRLRTINCDLDTADWTGTATAACKIGTQDMSEWLVENGWAEPAAGSPLAEAAEKAKQAKKGIYGDDPRKGAPLTIPPGPPPDDPLDPL